MAKTCASRSVFVLLLIFVLLAVGATGARASVSNDDCSGAIAIPDGPYPVVTSPVDALTATPQGADDTGLSASCNPSGMDYTVWYTFTPATTGTYRITTCPATGATGNTVQDTVLAVLQSTDNTCGGSLNSVACNDVSSCTSLIDPATVTVGLSAGGQYYIVAGHYLPDTGMVPGASSYVLSVDYINAAANDTCSGAIPFPLNRTVVGTTLNAGDDYQTPATTACYAGLPGTQAPTTAPGRDVVYSFTAPADGQYSFRQIPNDFTNISTTLRVQNPVLYASASCPPGGGTVSCLAGANRLQANAVLTSTGTNVNMSEELRCLPLTAGQTIYVFFDDAGSGASNPGGSFALEATPCHEEVEPNDTTATATPYSAASCGETEGSASVGPAYHCVLGVNAGATCQTTNTGPVPNCGGAPGLCFPDSVCENGPNAGLACVPKCVGGATPGTTCTTSTQCGTGGSCQTNGGCGVCTAGTLAGKPCVANANCGTGGVCAPGTCGRTTNEGDVDFWSVGTPAAGSKIYAAIDAPASNDYDWRMRITSTTDTLGFDEDDGTPRQGTLASTISGAVATGTETFVKVSRTSPFASEPYRLYAVVEPPVAQAQAEQVDGWDITYGWPGDGLFADYLNNGADTGYVRGTFFSTHDSDCYKALAHEGDDLVWFGDSNPNRTTFSPNAGPSVPQVIIYDAAGAAISNFLFATDTTIRNTGPASTPGLNGTVPRVSSFFQHWRATYTGMFELCFYPFGTSGFPITGPFPAAYAGVLTVNCGPMMPAGPGTTTADVSITEAGPAGPIATSSFVEYNVTITNNGSEIAQEVAVHDLLPPGLVYLGLTIVDGFGGHNTTCSSTPTPGTAGGAIDCTTMSLAPGASATYTLSARVANCIGGGLTISNPVSITTTSTDLENGNDVADWSFDTANNAQCVDLACTAESCIVNTCTTNDHCDNGACVTAPVDCNDDNDCTVEECDPIVGQCVYAPNDGASCDDGNLCTQIDRCQAGACVGSDSLDCSADCPAGFRAINGACQKTYTIDASLLDHLGTYCNGQETSRFNFDGATLSYDEYGFHWTDLGGALGPVVGVDVDFAEGVSCQPHAPFNVLLNGTLVGNFTKPSNLCDCNVGGTTSMTSISTASYVKGGTNAIAIRAPDNDGGLRRDPAFDNEFARVTVRYLPSSGPVAACSTGQCNPATGACGFVNGPDGVTCDDGDACTTASTCSAGSCVGSEPPNCDDGDICTEDSCNAESGCVHLPFDCSDGDACTVDTCNGMTGCQHAASCSEGASVAASNFATTDAEGDGATPTDPIETDVRTNDGTVGNFSIQEGPATQALPSGYQVLDLQIEVTAPPATIAAPLGLRFRIDASALPAGFALSSLSVFRNGVPVANCADPGLGGADPDPCVVSRSLMSDGDAVIDVATSHASTWNLGIGSCDDGNPCTDDGVFPNCVHTFNTAACDDGNACTQHDSCQGGTCAGGSPVTCLASDACHDAGICNPSTGACSNPAKANGTACNDGNACTQTDTCQAGSCAGSTPVVCAALDQCHTAGTCNPSSGACSNPARADGSSCSDGSACTQADICQGGVCTGTNDSWSGVLQPVNADGTSVFKLGSTIPVKFKLTGACAGNPNLLATIYFYKVSDGEGPINEAASTSAADTSTTFRYSSSDDQYIYNLGTKGLTDGRWQLGVDLHDGVGIRAIPVGLRK